ncbi:hypothetical protein GH733_009813 [Mirounga leonina]|nr:hypothetical protein GH733_009813 [Mirounga leonina]
MGLKPGWSFSMGSAYQFHSWRVFVIVCALPCVSSVVALTFMPESPRFLLEVGKHDEAWMILKLIHDTNMRARGQPEKVFSVHRIKTPKQIDELIEIENDTRTWYRRCFVRIRTELYGIWLTFMRCFNYPVRENTIKLTIVWFTLSFGYYGLSVWFPDVIKHLQVNMLPIEKIEREKFSNFSVNFTMANQLHTGAEYDNGRFLGMKFKSVTFKDSLFKACLFEDVTSVNTYFKNCTFIDTVFDNTDFEPYKFTDSEFQNCSFFRNKTGCQITFDDDYSAYWIYFVNFLGTLAVLPGNIVSALLMDRIGRLTMLGGSMVLSGISCFFLWLGSSESMMVGVLCLYNGLTISAWNSLDVITVELYPTDRRCGLEGESSRDSCWDLGLMEKANKVEYVSVRLGSQDSFEKHCQGFRPPENPKHSHLTSAFLSFCVQPVTSCCHPVGVTELHCETLPVSLWPSGHFDPFSMELRARSSHLVNGETQAVPEPAGLYPGYSSSNCRTPTLRSPPIRCTPVQSMGRILQSAFETMAHSGTAPTMSPVKATADPALKSEKRNLRKRPNPLTKAKSDINALGPTPLGRPWRSHSPARDALEATPLAAEPEHRSEPAPCTSTGLSEGVNGAGQGHRDKMWNGAAGVPGATGFGFLNALCKAAAVLGNLIFGSLVSFTKSIPILLASTVLVCGGLSDISCLLRKGHPAEFLLLQQGLSKKTMCHQTELGGALLRPDREGGFANKTEKGSALRSKDLSERHTPAFCPVPVLKNLRRESRWCL